MTLVLYSVPHSLYCAKTRILLRAKGLTWEERLPKDDPEGFAQASAFGNLPALRDDGFCISDSEAIAEYLEEAYPDVPLLPDNLHDRARMRERGRFHDTRLEPALRLTFPLVARPDRDGARGAGAALSARLGQLAGLLAHPLPFGLGDCGFAPTFLWIDLLCDALAIPVSLPPAVRLYRAKLEQHPAVAAELAAYRPHAQDWITEKKALRQHGD